jgi:hypothetical protein
MKYQKKKHIGVKFSYLKVWDWKIETYIDLGRNQFKFFKEILLESKKPSSESLLFMVASRNQLKSRERERERERLK